MTTAVPTVLFLCVHNAGRSQMASGWMRHLAGDRIEVMSGGSEPASQVNPAAVQAMKEVGIDITGQRPKLWTDQTVGAADVVVTMGCGDTCPVLPGKRYLDWELDDPAGMPVEGVRPVRDEIERRVRGLLRRARRRTPPPDGSGQRRRASALQGVAQDLEPVRPGAEPRPLAALLALEQPGVRQDRKVVADRRLAATDRLGEVTRADLAAGSGRHEAEQAQADGVGEDLETAGQLLCLVLARGRTR